MQRVELETYLAANVGLIHAVTKSANARLVKCGVSYDYEDLFQDLSITFIKAFDKYNDNLGYKFSTYFTVAARHEANKIVDKLIAERVEGKTRSVEEMTANFDDQADASEQIMCGGQTPEEHYISIDKIKGMVSGLSPLAYKIVEMTIDPPDFIEREHQAQVAYAKRSRDTGVEKRVSENITVAFVCGVLTKLSTVPVMDIRAARIEINSAARGHLT